MRPFSAKTGWKPSISASMPGVQSHSSPSEGHLFGRESHADSKNGNAWKQKHHVGHFLQVCVCERGEQGMRGGMR